MKTKNRIYDLVSYKPVAKFYYKGSHSHPVKRIVLVVEERDNMIIGYEIQEGKEFRSIKDSFNNIKSYRKDRIAKWGDYKRLRMSSKTLMKNPEKTTLERYSINVIFSKLCY